MRAFMVVAVLVSAVPSAAAQSQPKGWRFQWKVGQQLSYKTEQTTAVVEEVEGKKAETKSTLATTKQWQVTDVAADGTATLSLSLAALRVETTSPTGEVMRFDSADPDKSTPQLKEQMTKYVGAPVAVLRVSDRGKVVEVKECRFGSASRFESEPPFVLTFPDDVRAPSWERNYEITVDPPQGTGEKYPTTQKYGCRAVNGNIATVFVRTALGKQPEPLADQIPLLQFQPEGDVQFDFHAGLMKSARLHVQKELKNHQGEGSSYRLESNYQEELSEAAQLKTGG